MATKILDRFVTELLFRGDLRQLNRIERRVDAIRQKLDAASRAFTIVGTASLAALAGVTYQAISTDRAMKTLQARLGLTADEAQRFKEQAYRVGSRLPLDTSDIIRAQIALGQLGLTKEEVLAATPAVAKIAVAAEGLDIQDAARFAALGVQVFDVDPSNIEGYLSAMLKMETMSPATVKALGDAFQYSGALAKAAGISNAAYFATLAGMSESGREIEASSQGLTTMLTQLSRGLSSTGRGGKMVEKILGQVGVKLEEARGVWQTAGPDEKLPRFFELLLSRVGGDAEKLIAVFAQFGGQSFASALLTAAQKTDVLRERTAAANEEMENGAEIQRQVEIRMRGISGAWDLARAMVDTFINRLADAGVSNPVEKILRSFSSLVDWLVKTDENGEVVNQRLLGMMSKGLLAGTSLLFVGIALKALSFALGGFTALLRLNIWLTNLWNNSLLVLRGRLAAIAIWQRVAAIGAGKLGSTFRAGSGSLFAFIGRTAAGVVILKALGAIVAIIGAKVVIVAALLATAALLVYKYWNPIKAFFAGIGDGIMSALEPLAPELSAIWSAISYGASALMNAIRPLIGWFLDLLVPIEEGSATTRSFAEAGRSVGQVIGGFLRWSINAAVNAINILITTIKALWELVTFGPRLLSNLGRILFDAFTGDIAWGDVGMKIIGAIIYGIKSVGSALYDAVAAAFEGVADLLPFSDAREGPLSRLTASGRSIVQTLADGVTGAGDGVLTRALRGALDLSVGSISNIPGLTAALPAGPPTNPEFQRVIAGGNTNTSQKETEVVFQPGAITFNVNGDNADDIVKKGVTEIERQIRVAVRGGDSQIVA